MTTYEIFGGLYGFAAVAGGVLGVVFLILRGRARSWSASIGSLLFFVVPFSVLCRLLSKPLEQQSIFWIYLQVAVVALWLAGGAAAAFRTMRAKERANQRI
jgi:hypothetical protein